MKKKLYVTRTVKAGCFLLALLLSCVFLQSYALRRLDHNTSRLKGYYRQPNGALDVVLLGASDIYTGFSACRAYEKFGFTSYPYATESITGEGTLLALKEIVRTQTPKLIVIEPNAFLYKRDKNEQNDAHIRKLLDNVPLSANKMDYINRNVAGDEQREYYFPLMKYHGMWSDYPQQGKKVLNAIEQDVRGAFYLKGFRTTAGIFQPEEKVFNDKVLTETKAEELNPHFEQQLRELLDYCKEQQLNVVFVRTPHLVIKDTYGRVKRSNRAAEIIAGYGYDYINLERTWDKVGLELTTDFYNYDHLNIYGTVKLTDYLGNILQTKYNVGKRTMTPAEKEEWDTAADYFNRLFRYCDELMQQGGEPVKLDEDVNTFRTLEKRK